MRSKIKKILPKWLLAVLKQLRYYWIVMAFHIFHLFPIKKRRIVVCNVWGFGDNAKYVTEELVRRKQKILESTTKNTNPFEIIFITNHPNTSYAPKKVKVLKTNSLRAILALSTAKVWVDNNRKENYIKKRKGQYYIQTWHGGIALKKIEKDYEENLGQTYVNNAIRDSRMTDLYISNSNFCTNMYQNSFWYQGEILECGSPRNDILLNKNAKIIHEVRTRLGVKSDYKIAIYAPTYREGNDLSVYQLDCNKLISTLEHKFGHKWVIAVRLHPLVSGLSDFLDYSSRVINATHYRDIYELMAAGDVLITDYSNIMFEFSFMKKPVFLYATDVTRYEKERGFYFKYDSLPYERSLTQGELFNNINNYREDLYLSKTKAFFENLELYESGNASEQVVDRIIHVING
jgi:CDP-glycerol glycerophosphotransferase